MSNKWKFLELLIRLIRRWFLLLLAIRSLTKKSKCLLSSRDFKIMLLTIPLPSKKLLLLTTSMLLNNKILLRLWVIWALVNSQAASNQTVIKKRLMLQQPMIRMSLLSLKWSRSPQQLLSSLATISGVMKLPKSVRWTVWPSTSDQNLVSNQPLLQPLSLVSNPWCSNTLEEPLQSLLDKMVFNKVSVKLVNQKKKMLLRNWVKSSNKPTKM